MSKSLVSDELWETLRPLLPQRRVARRRGGRPRLDDRRALAGIVFVLRTGIPWEYLPREMGCGSGMICWRRLRDWHRAGVWRKLHRRLLGKLRAAGRIDFSRALVDSASVRALFGDPRPARTPWIVGRMAPNTTCWSTPMARHSRRCLPAPTATM